MQAYSQRRAPCVDTQCCRARLRWATCASFEKNLFCGTWLRLEGASARSGSQRHCTTVDAVEHASASSAYAYARE